MVTSLPRVHVAVMGDGEGHPLDDRPRRCSWPSWRGAPPGRSSPSYTTLVRRAAPARGELEGPEEFHLILMDNGRITPDRRPAARGALLPALRRLPQRLPGLPADRRPRLRLHVPRAHRHPPDRDAQGRPASVKDLAHASSLCGACKDVCPVRIDIPRMLDRAARGRRPEQRIAPWRERMVFGASGSAPAPPRALPARRADRAAAPAAVRAGRPAPAPAPVLR